MVSKAQTPDSTLTGYVKKTEYSANSVLVAETAGLPVALEITEGSVLGYPIDGSVGNISITDLNGMIHGTPAAGTVFSGDGILAPAFRALPEITLDKIDISDTPITLEDLINVCQSAGIYYGGEISVDRFTNNVIVAAALGMIRTSDSDIGSLKSFTSEETEITYTDFADDDLHFIYIEYSGGSVSVEHTTDRNNINGHTAVEIGSVYRNGTDIEVFPYGTRIDDHIARSQERLLAAGFSRVSGSEISEGTGLQINITSGVWYYGLQRVEFNSFDNVEFEHYYYLLNGSWAEITPATSYIDVLHYNNVSTPGSESLATLTSNRYGVHWIYMCHEGNVHVVYGRGDYNTISSANAAQPPATLPNYLTDFGMLVGKVIVKKSASSFTSIESAFKVLFTPSAVTTHNGLGGLQGGTADEYYHFASSRYTDLLVGALTSADDTTYTLDTADPGENVVIGTGILYWIDLGDATTYSVAAGSRKKFKIHNSTPEFVGVKNGNSSVWVRLPPRATLEAILLTNSDANGTWHVIITDPALMNPAFGFSGFTDFMDLTSSYNMYGPLSVYAVASGIGASADLSSGGPVGCQGFARYIAGTATTGYILGYVGGASITYLTGGCRAAEIRIGLSTISSAADEYIFRFGIGNNITGGAHTVGCYLLYDRAGLGTTYYMKNVNSGGTLTTDTTVSPSFGANLSSPQKLRVEVSSAGTRSDFFINGVQVSPVGGMNTRVPASNEPVKPAHFGMTKSAYSAVNQIACVDYLRVQSYPTTLR